MVHALERVRLMLVRLVGLRASRDSDPLDRPDLPVGPVDGSENLRRRGLMGGIRGMRTLIKDTTSDDEKSAMETVVKFAIKLQ